MADMEIVKLHDLIGNIDTMERCVPLVNTPKNKEIILSIMHKLHRHYAPISHRYNHMDREKQTDMG